MKRLFHPLKSRVLLAAVALMGVWAVVTAPGAVAATGALELGVLPNVSARMLIRQYEPIQSHLAQQLGVPVNVSTAQNWREFYQRLKQGEYSVAVLAANVARLAEKDLGFRPLVAYAPLIPGLLVTKKGESAPPPALLGGKTLALANPASLVAFEGLLWLDKQGLAAGKHYQTTVVRAEDSVGSVLLRGEAAAGVMSMGEFLAHPPEVRDQLQVHTRFADVSSFVVMSSPHMESAEADRLQALLLGFGSLSADAAVFFERSGFKAIQPVDRAALQKMDIHLSNTRRLLD